MPTIKRLIQRIRQPELTHPPAGASNYVLLILDSCRFDALLSARPEYVQARSDRATFLLCYLDSTGFSVLMGLLPRHLKPSYLPAHITSKT